MSILKTENLNYIYSEDTPFEMAALKNVNIEIEKGDFVGIIGHTGSGKSTLVQHFNGIVKPTSGKVYFNGEDIWKDGKVSNDLSFQVGLVFQYPEYQLFDETVEKDIAFGPRNMGLSESEILERVEMAAHYVELSKDVLQKSPFDLSGGQKRRVAIAGVLAMEPEVLILDEPTAGLDPKGRDEIFECIQKLREKLGITVILVSHSMEDVAKYVDRIIVMNQGKVLMDDVPREVFKRYKELEAVGLSAPQVTYIMEELREKGLPVDISALTVEEARDEILRVLRR